MQHCQLLQTDEIQVIVGDASRDGVGRTQYCGLWSLTSEHRQFNAFGNSYAGLLPGEIRLRRGRDRGGQKGAGRTWIRGGIEILLEVYHPDPHVKVSRSPKSWVEE